VVIADDASVERALGLACELVTRQPLVAPQIGLGPSAWRTRLETAAPTGPMGGSWLRDFDPVMQIVFELYEEDFGSTRRTLHALNAEDPRIPYLRLLIMHALFELEGAGADIARHRGRLERAIRRLFDEAARLATWAEAKRNAGVMLKALAGMTNTVIGMYDWIAREPRTGFERIFRGAEARLDLGGGYGTPDLSRLVGAPLTSLDLNPPSGARAVGLRRFQVALRTRRGETLPRTRWQNDAEAAAYFAELERQPWQAWDAFADALDEGAASYLITSFGFLTSTVASHSPNALGRERLGKNVLAQMHTTRIGLERVLRLAMLGKDVTLFTYQRATSRMYRNVTVLLRFAAHRLVDSALYEAPFQLQGAGILPPWRPPA
jgi:hypothetical protein